MELFTDNWGEPPVLYEGERLYRVHTDNQSDELYVVRPANPKYRIIRPYDDSEFREQVRYALRRKYGKRGWYMLESLEDVTDLYCCDTTED